MKVILTGASGFLGRHIAEYFSSEELISIGRTEGTIKVQLDKEVPLLPIADLVIHNAGKAHTVPKTNAEAEAFFDVNVNGTRNLLIGLEQAGALVKGFVFISTIAVYGLETGVMIDENVPLLAQDPYGRSKIEAEELIVAWCGLHQIPYAILRLPLIAGQNPPGNLKSMINGIRKGYYFNIGGGKARKSMVLASSIAQFILPAIAATGIFNLTDGYHPSFKELSDSIAEQLGKGKPKSLPNVAVKGLAILGDVLGQRFPFNSRSYKKMVNDLTFNDTKARVAFGWAPLKVIDNFKI